MTVRVTDSQGLVHPDSAATISDKIFGTYGDPENMKSQFEACSFNKLKITNNYSRDISRHLAAPGVVEVTIGVSLSNSRGAIYSAAVQATQSKLGFTLPGNFDHVMFVLEDCYQDCGWAGKLRK